LWNLEILSIAGTATVAGSAVYSVRGKAVAVGEDLDAVAYTLITSAQVSSIFRSNTLAVSAVSGGNFDSVVSLSANDYLFLEVNRHGGNAGDTISDFWDVKAVTARMNVL
jgi:hypothetical protein